MPSEPLTVTTSPARTAAAGTGVAELAHVAEDGDAASAGAGLDPTEYVERAGNGDRARVVAVVDQFEAAAVGKAHGASKPATLEYREAGQGGQRWFQR